MSMQDVFRKEVFQKREDGRKEVRRWGVREERKEGGREGKEGRVRGSVWLILTKRFMKTIKTYSL